jgi:hypothetical protein
MRADYENCLLVVHDFGYGRNEPPLIVATIKCGGL